MCLGPAPVDKIPFQAFVLASQDCNPIGAKVVNVGVYKDLEADSGLAHEGFHEPTLDDVVSFQHGPDICSILVEQPQSQASNVNSNTGGQYPWHQLFQETLESSVQGNEELVSAAVVDFKPNTKDCSLLNSNNHRRFDIKDVTVSDAGENDILCVMCSPLGKPVTVYSSCITGNCSCVYYIGDVPCQLKPCRFAAVIFSNPDWAHKYTDLLWCITDGFPIVDDDVPSYYCRNYNSITEPVGKEKMDKIVRSELAENVISMVDYTPHCVHSLGAVPKPGGGIRPISDCSRPTGLSVNNFCSSLFKEFSYKSVDDVVDILKWGMCMSVVDIKSAYRAVPIRQEHRKYMGFEWELDGIKKVFVENRLCFGLRLGPQYFQLISNFIHDILLNVYDVETVNYLDDFITLGRSYEKCLNAQGCILKVLRDLGFYVAYDKVSPPSTCTIFLGIEIDSVSMELRLPEAKILKLNNHLDAFIAAERISKVDLESLGGLLSPCAHLVRGGRTFCRRLYNLYKEVCSKGLKSVKIPDGVRADLKWWKVFCRSFNGVSQINNRDYHEPMVSDASLKGFGVYLGRDWAAGSWDLGSGIKVESGCEHVSSPPIQDRDLVDFSNINVLELWPILVGLRRWSNLLKNSSLTVFTDNTQVMFMLIKGSSTNVTCMAWIKEIYWICVFNNIELKPKYISTDNNLIADTLSRLNYCDRLNDSIMALYNANLCCASRLLDNYREGQQHLERESL